MEVVVHEEAVAELLRLATRERVAMAHAFEKLEAMGEALGFPHSAAVKGAPGLRELRPRRGNSPWRAFYRRIGEAAVVGSIGPEAQVDAKGFAKAVRLAKLRLSLEGSA